MLIFILNLVFGVILCFKNGKNSSYSPRSSFQRSAALAEIHLYVGSGIKNVLVIPLVIATSMLCKLEVKGVGIHNMDGL